VGRVPEGEGPYVARTRDELEMALGALRRQGRRVGFVPTMGYLHAGHEALVRRAREDGMAPVLSIFVNPLQFGPQEDYARYPRDEGRDLEVARRAGVEVVYLPSLEDLLPQAPQTVVRVPSLMEGMCAPWRPGHFEGVALIVVRLFSRVRPDAAYFGEKDAQQLALVRQVTEDLDLPVRVVGVPTVREPDGLAMSSRNAYLSPKERVQALALYRSLRAGEERLAAGERDPDAVAQVMAQALAQAEGVRPEYAEVRDPDGLQVPPRAVGRILLAVAAWVGNARLIDNLRLWVPREGLPVPLQDDPPGAQGELRQALTQRLAQALFHVLGGRYGSWRRKALKALQGVDHVDGATLREVLAAVEPAGVFERQAPSPEEREGAAQALERVYASTVYASTGKGPGGEPGPGWPGPGA
jgi:pantoate--beta-alanine ligase